jgi:hypothetical protein
MSVLDNYGTPHTDNLHVEERYRVITDEKGKGLEVRFRVEDPGTFTMPWSGMAIYRPSRDTEMFEVVCAENQREFDDSSTLHGSRSEHAAVLTHRGFMSKSPMNAFMLDACPWPQALPHSSRRAESAGPRSLASGESDPKTSLRARTGDKAVPLAHGLTARTPRRSSPQWENDPAAWARDRQDNGMEIALCIRGGRWCYRRARPRC